MHAISEVIIILFVLVAAFFCMRAILRWQVNRAKGAILGDLRSAGAFGGDSAVMLDYSKPFWQRVGLRDYRPMMLDLLVRSGEIKKTPDGKYYFIPNPRER